MSNGALNSNPPNAQIHISNSGSDWLWTVFALFLFSLFVTLFFHFRRPRGTRLFHQIAVVVLTVGSLAYFSMASDLGATPIAVEFRGHGSDPTRQIWYVRYIQWFINFPLLLLSLLLVTGLSLSDIFTTLFMGEVLVITGLVGALVHSTYKWGYYVFGVFALFYVWYALLVHATATTFAAGGVFRPGYIRSAAYLSFMLLTYPICWAVSEGGNVIKPTSEMIWYGILDLLTGPVFLGIFLYHLSGVDYSMFGFSSGKYTDTAGAGVGTSAAQTKAQEAGVAQP